MLPFLSLKIEKEETGAKKKSRANISPHDRDIRVLSYVWLSNTFNLSFCLTLPVSCSARFQTKGAIIHILKLEIFQEENVYLHQGSYVSCLSFWLYVELHKTYQTNFHKTWRLDVAWAKKKSIKKLSGYNSWCRAMKLKPSSLISDFWP